MATILQDNLSAIAKLLRDSRDGYQKCAEEVEDTQLKAAFARLSKKRSNMLEALRLEAKSIQKEDAITEESGSITAAGHRLFIDIKSLLSGGDKDAILNEVERGENYLISKYDDIINENQELPVSLKNLLQMQRDEVRNDVKDLRK